MERESIYQKSIKPFIHILHNLFNLKITLSPIQRRKQIAKEFNFFGLIEILFKNDKKTTGALF